MQETIKKCIESIDVLKQEIAFRGVGSSEEKVPLCSALVEILERLESAEKKGLDLAKGVGSHPDRLGRALGGRDA